MSARLFRSFFRRQFLPSQSALSASQLKAYKQAVATFLEFAGPKVSLRAVTDRKLSKFLHAAEKMGRATKHRRDQAGLIRQIVLAWDPTAVRKPRHRAELPPPAAGSLREYFEGTYAPEAMVGVRDFSVEDTRRTLRALYQFCGDDLPVDQQTDALAAEFFRHLVKHKRVAATVNRYRRTWFAVWRHAYDRGLVERPPRVKKLKEVRNPPDSWTASELAAILDAAAEFRPDDRYGEVPSNFWWHAILLVGFWTGLRLGSLWSIRRADLNLASGLLFVDGENMKNGCGMTFRLPDEAIAAVQKIWLPQREFLFDCEQSISMVHKHFGHIVQAAGIPSGRRKNLAKFHKLRRSVATELASVAGVAAASMLLGHSSAVVTGRYVDPARLKAHDVTAILPPLLPKKPR